MPTAKLSGLAPLFGRIAPPTAPDGELLARFVATRDEAAFAELVRRYGPLVFAVCRRVTGDHHLAEDAFQAVFVVLARKAGCVRPAAALPAFLHAVATRTALRARTVADRRRRRETPVAAVPDVEGHEADPADATDLAAAVDEEIARLPDALRAAVVLCELEGCSRKDAAARLGVPEGTVSSRLAAARKALAARLRGRGVALGAAGLSAVLGRHATARVPAALAARAVASALSPGVVPAAVAALSTGVLRIMLAQKLKAVLPLALFALGGLACLALAAGPPELPPPTKPPAFVSRPADPPAAKPTPKPLPKGPNRILIRRDDSVSGERRWHLLDPDGKNERQVASAPGMVGVRLAPDGRRIAAMVYGDRKLGDDPNQGSLHVRGLDEKGVGTDLGVAPDCHVWSRDGSELACSEYEDTGEKLSESSTHYIVDTTTKAKTAVKLPSGHAIDGWSPDGKHFLTHHRGQTPEPFSRLYLMNRDGTEHKALTDAKERAVCGRLSPDGGRILYAVVVPPEQPIRVTQHDLIVLHIASGKVAKVRDVPLNVQLLDCCWAPDGRQIAYLWRTVAEGAPADGALEKETETHLIVCDPDGGNQKTVLSEKGTGIGMAMSELDWR